MKEMYFKKKITHLKNVRDFLEGAMVATFLMAVLLVDSLFFVAICSGIFIILGLFYIYVDLKMKAYKKSLYYYRKHVYSRPIMLHAA